VVLGGKIATHFNRALVSAQNLPKGKPLEFQMDWLANGLQDVVPEMLSESDAFDRHLSPER
jgi:hypothetical protein